MRFISAFIIISSLILTSCHKDEASFDEELISTFTAQVVQEINGNILGYVYDENNLPVPDASVQIYSSSIKTNKHGVFIFKNVQMDKNGTYIKVIKNGYILGSDMVFPSERATTYSNVKLLALENSKILSSNSGGIVQITGGGKIVFGKETFVSADGSIYNGNVVVTAKFLNPNQRDLGNVMPGGLIADASNGNTVVLGTLGMIAVELRDDQGGKLNLKTGSKATIEIPATTSYRPNEIQLWSFDENKGRWKEEGVAILNNNVYVAEVSHFSFWNCDAPFPLVEVCGKVVYSNGSPAVNIGVQVMVEGLGVGYGTTNNEGVFCGKMPKGKKLTIKINHYNCIGNVSEVMVGPFENNTILDNIVIQNIPAFLISGNIKCNNTPVSEGIIVVKIKESTIIFEAKEDGSFEYDLTQYLCGEPYPVTVFGFNNVSSETSAIITLDNSNMNQILLNVCSSGCDMNGAISFDCIDKITIAVSNGSGNYTYKWNDNLTTGPTLTTMNADSLIEGGLFCVTVTDAGNNCNKVFCKEVKGKPFVNIQANCQTGALITSSYDGVLPHTYLWANGSTAREIIANAIGQYCVTVSDNNGCTGSACYDWNGGLSIEPNPAGCNANTYSINSSPFTGGSYYGGSNIFNNLTYPIQIDIFKSFFTFKINIYGFQCEISKDIMLPQLDNGLTASVVNTTCTSCSDGKIMINVNTSASCFQCQIGGTKIFNINDLTNDLSAQNNASMMPKGEYYAVVTDLVTGCYIAFKKVKIE